MSRKTRFMGCLFLVFVLFCLLYPLLVPKGRGEAVQSTSIALSKAVLRKWAPTDMFNLLFPTVLTLSNDVDAKMSKDGQSKTHKSSPGPDIEAKSGVTRLTISEVLYSGRSSDGRTAKLIATAYPEPFSDRGKRYLTPSDPNTQLDVLAKRILSEIQSESDAPPWLAVLELEAVWKPWSLVISTRRAALASQLGIIPPSRVNKVLNNEHGPTRVRELDTSKLMVPLTDSTSIALSVAMSFASDSIVVGLFPQMLASDMPLPGSDGDMISTRR